MDAASIDGLLAELRPRLLHRHLGRVRLAGAHALVFDLSRADRLWCEAGREAPGLYLLSRDDVRGLPAATSGDEAPGPTRQALLLARKHLQGARVDALQRVAGARTVVLQAAGAALALRWGGAAPALTLVLGQEKVATVGDGPPAWPPPAPELDRELGRIEPGRLDEEVAAARVRGWSAARAWLAACPALGPDLARLLAAGGITLQELQSRLTAPRATILSPRPLGECDDADLAAPDAVRLFPFVPPSAQAVVTHPPTWAAATVALLGARLRGARFARLQRGQAQQARARLDRLLQLERRLVEDQRQLPAPDDLRHRAEALLAWAGTPAPGTDEVTVPDPYDDGRRLRITIDPRLGVPQNADRLFDKARRIERAARHVQERLRRTRAAVAEAGEARAAALAARNASELATPVGSAPPRAQARAGPRRYLTSRGLLILVGRGARQNQELTFGTAGPEDWWLHAREAPGAHVVLRDPEGRALEQDLREAAEVAAFFSETRAGAQADVHVTRRKHVRAGGAPGRVRVLQSETLRVRPRDPQGRLRTR